MLNRLKDLKKEVIDKKCYIHDDIIDKQFIMDHLECAESHAYKIIRKVNKFGYESTKRTPLKNGTTVLSWYYQVQGLKGEFI